MLALDELRKKVDEFVGRLSLRKAFNVLITLIIFAPMYYLLHPRWLHWTVALLIALILAVAVIWLYDDPPKKRIWIGLAWVGLFGLWYCFHLAWLSAISAVILALLIAVLAYGIRRPSLPKPRAYYIEPWDTDRQNLLLEAWKQTVAVQMHFNDLELRIRNYALTLLLAAGGAAAISLKENIYFQIHGKDIQVHISVLLLSFGLLGWLGFYLMDRFWYHRLLYGAVEHGRFIEEEFGDKLSFLRLTGAIGDQSPIWFLGIRIRTPRKIDIFYGLFAFLLLAAIYLAYVAKKAP